MPTPQGVEVESEEIILYYLLKMVMFILYYLYSNAKYNANGKLSDERYATLSMSYEEEPHRFLILDTKALGHLPYGGCPKDSPFFKLILESLFYFVLQLLQQ